MTSRPAPAGQTMPAAPGKAPAANAPITIPAVPAQPQAPAPAPATK
jgi:hypothetical protein